MYRRHSPPAVAGRWPNLAAPLRCRRPCTGRAQTRLRNPTYPRRMSLARSRTQSRGPASPPTGLGIARRGWGPEGHGGPGPPRRLATGQAVREQSRPPAGRGRADGERRAQSITARRPGLRREERRKGGHDQERRRDRAEERWRSRLEGVGERAAERSDRAGGEEWRRTRGQGHGAPGTRRRRGDGGDKTERAGGYRHNGQ